MAVLKIYNGVEWVSIASNLGSGSFNIDQSGGTSDTYGVLSGAVNSANTTFTTSQSIYVTGTLTVYLNGQLQVQGSSEDWTETSPAAGTFDFIVAPTTGDEIAVTYQSISSTIGNADLVDGIHASNSATANQLLSLDSNSDLDLGANNLINLSNVSATVSDQDLLFNINDGGVDRTAIVINAAEGSVTFPRQSYVLASLEATVVSTDTWTKVGIRGSGIVDVLGEVDYTTNKRFTALDDGVYFIECSPAFSAASGDHNMLSIYKNGSNLKKVRYGSLAVFESMYIGIPVQLDAGEYVECWIFQSSGSNKTIQLDGGLTSFSVSKSS